MDSCRTATLGCPFLSVRRDFKNAEFLIETEEDSKSGCPTKIRRALRLLPPRLRSMRDRHELLPPSGRLAQRKPRWTGLTSNFQRDTIPVSSLPVLPATSRFGCGPDYIAARLARSDIGLS